MRGIWMLAIMMAAPGIARAAEGAPISIEGGKISGVEADGVRVYKGIRYAAAPQGDLRWKPPQPPAAWEGVLDCSEFGPDCPQLPYPKGSIYYSAPRPQSEDCLRLNVWTAAKPGEKLPVMVWIHGGGLSRGSGATPTYDGSNFARNGVALVTINYRLGPFGFLAHPELTAQSDHKSSGNYGILDQIAALAWVRKNIAAFGGDPSRVTIFGESAGSFSVNALAASPLASGLFQRAIGESGAMFGPMPRLSQSEPGRPSAEEMGLALAKAAGAASLAELRALPAEKLVDAMQKFPEFGGAFRSTVNVDGWVMPAEIREIFAQGKQNDVPTISGSNAKEMTTLTPPGVAPKTLDAYRAWVKSQASAGAEALATLYPAASDAEAVDAYFALSTDRAFGVQMRAWARAAARGQSKAYWYCFTRVPPLPNKEYNGAFHAAEIAYAFGNLALRGRSFEEADHKLSKIMNQYWVNFAKTGDPNGEGLPRWPAFNPAEEPCMIFSESPQAEPQHNKPRLDAVEKAFSFQR